MLQNSTSPTTTTSTATVFWDHENCPVPSGMHGYEVVRKIKDLLLSRSVFPTNIIAIGNTKQFTTQVKSELEESGVLVQNISSGKDNAADIGILGEILKTIFFHKPPHSIFLISGDRDFSKILNFLESVHYNVVLIHSNKISEVLKYSVRDRVSWLDLLMGNRKRSVTGRVLQNATSSSSPRMDFNGSSSADPSKIPSPPLEKNDSQLVLTECAPSYSDAPTSNQIEGNKEPRKYSDVLKVETSLLAGQKERPKSNFALGRFVPVLREVKAYFVKYGSDTPKTYFSVDLVVKLGFQTKEQWILSAQTHKLIETDVGLNFMKLTKKGFDLLELFKGLSAQLLLFRAPYIDMIKNQFHLLLSLLFDLNRTDVLPIKTQYSLLLGELNKNISKVKSFGFVSGTLYIRAAIDNKIVQLCDHGLNLVVILQPAICTVLPSKDSCTSSSVTSGDSPVRNISNDSNNHSTSTSNSSSVSSGELPLRVISNDTNTQAASIPATPEHFEPLLSVFDVIKKDITSLTFIGSCLMGTHNELGYSKLIDYATAGEKAGVIRLHHERADHIMVSRVRSDGVDSPNIEQSERISPINSSSSSLTEKDFNQYNILINCFEGTKPLSTSHVGEKLMGRFKQYGFQTLTSYVNQACKDSIIKYVQRDLQNGNSFITLTPKHVKPHLQSQSSQSRNQIVNGNNEGSTQTRGTQPPRLSLAECFFIEKHKRLIKYLSDSRKQIVGVSQIGEHNPGIHLEVGFSTLRSYLIQVEKDKVITIFQRDDRHGNMQVNLCDKYREYMKAKMTTNDTIPPNQIGTEIELGVSSSGSQTPIKNENVEIKLVMAKSNEIAKSLGVNNMSDDVKKNSNRVGQNSLSPVLGGLANLTSVEGKSTITQKIAPESADPIPSCAFRLPTQSAAVGITFKWLLGGKEIILKGSWDGWKENIRLVSYETVLTLPKGEYEYKYIVDGEWKCDIYRPIRNNNNLLYIE